MTTIFTSEHKSDQGRDYKLSIIDTESATFIGTMTVDSGGFEIKDTGKTRSLHSRINGKALSFTIQVENLDQENWIQTLVTEPEGRYLVEVERETDVIFRGVITTDSAQIDNAPKPYNFKLEAVDGVTLLKDVQATFGSTSKLNDHFFDALNKNPAAELYGISDSFLSVVMDWWSEEHVNDGQDTDGNALFKTLLTKGTFQDRDGIAFSAYTVIDEVCKLFNARLYYDEGVYHFEQLEIRNSNSTFDRQVYNTEQTLLTTNTETLDVAVNQSDNYHLAGGKFNILQPLRSVTVKYNTSPLKDFFPPDPPFEQEDPIVWRNVGSVLTGITDTQFRIYFQIDNFLNGPVDGPFAQVVFLLYLRIDGQYLSGNPNDLEWTTDTDAFVIFANYQNFSFPPINGFYELTTTTEMTTPDIPNGGDVEVALRAAYRTFNNATQEWEYEFEPPDGVSEPATHTWNITGQLLQTVSENSNLVPVQVSASQDSGYDDDEVTISAGDGFTPLRPGVLTIFDVAQGIFVATTGWRAGGSGSYIPISKLIAKTMLAERLRPLKMLSGVILCKNDVISISNRISYDSRFFIFNNSKFNSNFDEITVEGIELTNNDTGITIETEIELPEDVQNGIEFESGDDPTGEGGNDPEDPPDQGRDGLITSDVIYPNVAITSVPILEADDNYFVTGDEIIIKDNITGYEHKVIVDAPLSQGDTTITIQSYTPDRLIAIYSAITFAPGQLLNLRPKYQRFIDATGSSVTITNFTLPDETSLSDDEMSRRLRVFRQTSKIIYNIGFTVDSTNNKIDFQWDLQNEYVEVELL